ncbi:MAG: DUF368 domain-containing protein [Deltaproteobacteria bacterium]|nr:DUF368 domain-containing protein [Deltaproteobacteria bacterium]
MGAADVVPGVSGGTIAFILGIYEELLGAIGSINIRFIRTLLSLRFKEAMTLVPWKFLGSLVLGILCAVFSLARLLAWLLENKPILVWSFFFGLILASIMTVGRKLQQWDPSVLLWAAVGTVGTYFLVGMVPINTPETSWFLFLSGAVAICAMILPGISGSFILVLLGKYHFVLAAVNERNVFVLALFTAGAVFGITVFSRILNWLLKRHHDVTITLLIGLMVGSLRKVWPWKGTLETALESHGNNIPMIRINVLPSHWNSEVSVALTLAVMGFMLVAFLEFWVSRHKKVLEHDPHP